MTELEDLRESLTNTKKELKSELKTLRSDFEKISKKFKIFEENTEKAKTDTSRLSEELKSAQQHAQDEEMLRKEAEVRLDKCLKGLDDGKKTIRNLEEQNRELSLQVFEERTAREMGQVQINHLQHMIDSDKKSTEKAWEMAVLFLARYKEVNQNLVEAKKRAFHAEKRANHAEEEMKKMRAEVLEIGEIENSEARKNPLYMDLILDTVFSQLSRTDLFNCRLVSKQWKDLASSALFKPQFDDYKDEPQFIESGHVEGTIGYFLGAGHKFFDQYKPKGIALTLAYPMPTTGNTRNIDDRSDSDTDDDDDDDDDKQSIINIKDKDLALILQNASAHLESLLILTMGDYANFHSEIVDGDEPWITCNFPNLKNISISCCYSKSPTNILPPNFNKFLQEITSFSPNFESMGILHGGFDNENFAKTCQEIGIISRLKNLSIRFSTGNKIGSHRNMGQLIDIAKSGLQLKSFKLIAYAQYASGYENNPSNDYGSKKEVELFYQSLEEFLDSQKNYLEYLNLQIYGEGPKLDRVYQMPIFENLKKLVLENEDRHVENFGPIPLDKFPKLEHVVIPFIDDNAPDFSGSSSTVHSLKMDYLRFRSFDDKELFFWFYKLGLLFPNVKSLQLDKMSDDYTSKPSEHPNPYPNPWENTLETISITEFWPQMGFLENFKGLRNVELYLLEDFHYDHILKPLLIEIDVFFLRKIVNLKRLKIGRNLKVSKDNLNEVKRLLPKISIEFEE